MLHDCTREIEAAVREARRAAFEESARICAEGTTCCVCGRASLGYAPPDGCPQGERYEADPPWGGAYVKALCNFDIADDEDKAARIRALAGSPAPSAEHECRIDALRVELAEAREEIERRDDAIAEGHQRNIALIAELDRLREDRADALAMFHVRAAASTAARDATIMELRAEIDKLQRLVSDQGIRAMEDAEHLSQANAALAEMTRCRTAADLQRVKERRCAGCGLTLDYGYQAHDCMGASGALRIVYDDGPMWRPEETQT